eukprot:s2017_g11.t1
MVTASGQIVVGGNVPFSEVEGAWYQNNRYEDFVKDLNELEGKTGTLGFNSELRNRLVTFIAENYIPKAAGQVICPACLTETPNNLAICVKCTGSLISFGERTSPYPEAESPGEPRPEQPQDADVGDEDVHMDKDEIDRLVKETKAKNASEEHEDVNMEEDAGDDGEGDDQPRPSRPSPQREKTAAEEEQEKREAEADREQEEADAQEEANRMDTGPIPMWAVGITPEFIAKKLTDIADADEEDRPDIRREVSNFIRKMISGAFAVRSYDYFRVTPPNREDHIHMDPVSLACAAVERGRTFAVLYTLNKVGLGMPPALAKIWEGKLKSSQTSTIQLERNIDMLDPNDRPDAREYVRAIEDTTELGEGTPGSGQAGPSQKKAKRQKSDAGGGSSSSRRPTES